MQTLLPPLPFFFIGKQEASERVRKYQEEKLVLLSAQRPDTKHIWYTREHIRTLLDEMDYLQADGLRIYLGAYSDTHEYAPGQTCLIMVPTRYNAQTETNDDVMTEDEPGFSEREQTPKSFSGWQMNGTGRQLPKEYNYGAPCPPVCNGGPGLP